MRADIVAGSLAVLGFIAVLSVEVRPARIEATVQARAVIQTTIDMGAVLEAARSGDPQPYPLHADGGTYSSPVVLGVVYTPFVRVAMLAASFIRRGVQFSLDEIDPAVAAPVAFVAFRWYGFETVDARDRKQFQVARAADRILSGAANFADVADPLWVDYDLVSLRSYGQLPYDDIVAVAGYRLADITQARTLVIYRDGATVGRSNTKEIRVGRPTAAELERWR